MNHSYKNMGVVKNDVNSDLKRHRKYLLFSYAILHMIYRLKNNKDEKLKRRNRGLS